jgi:predicted DNA-binding transcriptional regulator YafY
MLSIPTPMMELGISQEMKAALLKLSAALPSTLKQAEGSVRQRVYIDTQKDEGTKKLVPFLHQVYDAVWEDRKINLEIRYFFGVVSEQVVNPYGLVSKAGRWYLVCENESGMLVYSLSSFHNIDLLEERFERDLSFDLAKFWKNWWENYGKQSEGYLVKLRVFDDAVPYLPWFLGSKIKEVLEKSPVDEEGRKIIEISYPSMYIARDRILALGRAVEVLEPLPLRMSVADYGVQIADLYGGLTGQGLMG